MNEELLRNKINILNQLDRKVNIEQGGLILGKVKGSMATDIFVEKINEPGSNYTARYFSENMINSLENDDIVVLLELPYLDLALKSHNLTSYVNLFCLFKIDLKKFDYEDRDFINIVEEKYDHVSLINSLGHYIRLHEGINGNKYTEICVDNENKKNNKNDSTILLTNNFYTFYIPEYIDIPFNIQKKTLNISENNRTINKNSTISLKSNNIIFNSDDGDILLFAKDNVGIFSGDDIYIKPGSESSFEINSNNILLGEEAMHPVAKADELIKILKDLVSFIESNCEFKSDAFPTHKLLSIKKDLDLFVPSINVKVL